MTATTETQAGEVLLCALSVLVAVLFILSL